LILAVAVQLPPHATETSQASGSGSAAEHADVRELLADPAALVRFLERHSREVLAAAARREQAVADLAQARLLPNPTLSAGLGDVPVGETNPPGLHLDDTAVYSIGVAQTIEIKKRGPRIESARLRLGSQRESELDALSDAVGRARLAIGRLLHLRMRQQVLEESLAAASKLLELQRSRLEHGDLSGVDYDRLSVDAMLLDSDVVQNRAELTAAFASCHAALFESCELGVAPPDATPAEGPEIPQDAPTQETLLAERPDIRSLELQRDAALQDAVLAGRRALPDATLSVGYTRDKLVVSGDQPRTLSFGLQLTLPLFDRGQADAARARARAAESQALAAARQLEARTDVAALDERRAALESTLAALEGAALKTSRRVLDATAAAVGAGELSMTDLLLARRTHNDLALRVADLRFAAFSVRNDLRQALGLDAELVRRLEAPRWTTP
jgi:cobalt-zinc-cadmium efflux system outer membrane protein